MDDIRSPEDISIIQRFELDLRLKQKSRSNILPRPNNAGSRGNIDASIRGEAVIDSFLHHNTRITHVSTQSPVDIRPRRQAWSRKRRVRKSSQCGYVVPSEDDGLGGSIPRSLSACKSV